MVTRLPASFTRDDTPALRERIERDLESLSHGLRALVPGAGVFLGGSFAQGEAVAWVRRGRLVSFSDYDLFLALPGYRWLSPYRLSWLRREVGELARSLSNPSLDLNLLLPKGPGRPWQPSGSLSRLAGPGLDVDSAQASEEAVWSFVLHTLHGVQADLLGLAPSGANPSLRRLHGINRCALRLLRAASNLQGASEPVYAVGACAGPLMGAWGRGLEPPVRAVLELALAENLELGLRAFQEEGVELPSSHELDRRWAEARRLADVLHERWFCWSHEAGSRGRGLMWRERQKAWLRLALVQVGAKRAPRFVPRPHQALLRARRELLAAVSRPGVVAAHQLRAGWRILRGLGLVSRSAPADPRDRWAVAVRACRVPNPLRLVVGAP